MARCQSRNNNATNDIHQTNLLAVEHTSSKVHYQCLEYATQCNRVENILAKEIHRVCQLYCTQLEM